MYIDTLDISLIACDCVQLIFVASVAMTMLILRLETRSLIVIRESFGKSALLLWPMLIILQ